MRHLRIAGLIVAITIIGVVGSLYALDPPHAGKLQCQNCHAMGKNFRGNEGLDLSLLCLDCHSPFNIGTTRNPKPANPYGTANAVVPQHKGTEHNFMGSDTNPQAKATTPTSAEFDRTYAKGQLSCASCHFAHVQPNGVVGGKYLRVPLGNNDELCLKCHTALNVTSLGGASHPLISFSGYSTGLFTQPQFSSLKKVYIAKGNKVTCTVCHTPHNAYPFATPTSTFKGNEYLGRAHVGDWLCAQCHKKPIHGSLTYGGEATCTKCHSMHNPGDNKSLVKSTMKNTHTRQDVVVNFTGNTAATDFYVASSSNIGPYPQLGICQVCHTKTKYFRNYSLVRYNITGNTTHNNANQPCIVCHNHEEDPNFVAPNIMVMSTFLKKAFGKESCGTCHGYPPATGAHLLHANSNIDKTDCAICHPNADLYTTGPGNGHQESGVTSWNETTYYTQVRPYINLQTWIAKDPANRFLDTCGTSGICHNPNSPTAKWGDTTLSCNACHGYPPATGNHAVHMAVRQIACKDCHYSVINDTTDTRSHIKVIVSEATDADLYKKRAWAPGSYTYNIAVNDRERNGGVSSYNSVDKSCANIQCHNPSGGSFKARWAVNGPSCSLCHHNSSTNATGTHYKHLSASTSYGRTITCGDCHPNVNATAYNHISSTINYIEIKTGLTYKCSFGL